MAKENYVHLHGRVRTTPTAVVNDKGEMTKVIISVVVLRRTTKGTGFTNKLFYDCPIIMSRNADMMPQLRALQENDVVDIKGVISTRDVIKASICPHCGTKNKVKGTLLYVTPLHIMKVGKVANEEEGYKMLTTKSEISNELIVIGYLCKDPAYYEDANGVSYARYPLAVNRRYHIKEDADDKRTDYPWVRTYGTQAFEDSQVLRKGSLISINGAIQVREIIRKTACCECEGEYEWTDRASEIVPYYIGYMDDSYKENLDKEEFVDET